MIDLHSEQTKLSGRWIQKGFLAIAVLFKFCLIAQLLTVGLAVFDDPTWWNIHVLLVRGYGGLVVLLLARLLINPFPQKIKPDVIELYELETGQRREGLFYSFMVFLQKICLGIALAVILQSLEWTGYIHPTDTVNKSKKFSWVRFRKAAMAKHHQ